MNTESMRQFFASRAVRLLQILFLVVGVAFVIVETFAVLHKAWEQIKAMLRRKGK